ncbi:proteasome subunit beta type-5 [Prorops nasuta]|uniref:proteasome subunit beta type-5 n=1 Tax=Prorops nasuta TaxID=863751 RepID=UPI0034CF0AF0
MALADVCGLNNFADFSNTRVKNELFGEIDMYSKNFENNLQLAVPPYINPAENLARLTDSTDETGKHLKIHFDHGTTTLAFQYQGGIIMAVDSRATGGQYIGSSSMKKIVEIDNYLIGTIAGGAADCVYWDRVLSKQCRIYQLRNRERISIAAASKLLSNMVYNYKGMGLSMGMMFAGWDKRGPGLYYVDSDGTRIPGKIFSVGSGSIFAFGALDAGHRWDLTDEEAYELGRRSIYHATFRDAYSGGIIRVYHVKPTGWVNISEQDCKDLHYMYQEKEGKQFQ